MAGRGGAGISSNPAAQSPERGAPRRSSGDLKGQYVAKRKINAKELVEDVRAGMDDGAMMRKYNLSPEQLEMVFEKLVEADFITMQELYERSKVTDSQITAAFVEAQRAIDELD